MPKLRKSIVVKPTSAEIDIEMPEIVGVSGESRDSDEYNGLGFSFERPKMEMKKPKVKVVKGSQLKPSSRTVAKVKTAPMPDISMPDLKGTGEGLLGGSGFAVENLDSSDLLQQTSLYGNASEPLGGYVSDAVVADKGRVDGLSELDSIAFGIDARQRGDAAVSKSDEESAADRYGSVVLSGSELNAPIFNDENQSGVQSAHVVGYDAATPPPLSAYKDLDAMDDLFGDTVVDEEGKQAEARLEGSVRAAAMSGEKKGWNPAITEEPAPKARPRKPAEFNPYVMAAENPFSTFSIDVDTASYGLARQQLLSGNLPEPEAVRTEEFINSFDYNYRPPAGGQTFAVHTEMAPSPFRSRMELLKIGVKGRRIGRDDHRGANLTLVIDTSGSMSTPERLGLVKQSLSLLIDQLNPEDRVAIVQFGGEARLVCEHTPVSQKADLLDAVNGLQAGGPTQFDKGLELGYQLATDGFKAGDSNRIIVMSDGVANLGELDPEAILQQVAEFRTKGVYLSVLGFGAGSYDDALLERLANSGDGTYAYVDTPDEARHLFVDQLAATLHTIASDVKIQIEFDPSRVLRYRQIGYENRQLTKEQFRDDTVDAGEVGSGQSVTALYEVELKPDALERDPIASVYVRYRRTDNGAIEEISSRVMDAERKARFEDASPRFQLAACVAEFAEHLRRSPYSEGTEMPDILRVLQPSAVALDIDGTVQELLRLISVANGLER